jgi:hypothetical protein
MLVVAARAIHPDEQDRARGDDTRSERTTQQAAEQCERPDAAKPRLRTAGVPRPLALDADGQPAQRRDQNSERNTRHE